MSDVQPDYQPSPPPMPPAGAAVPVYPSSSAPSVSPDKRRRNLFIIIGALVIGACVCCGLCVVGSGSMLFKALRERGPVEKTVDQFMNAMAAKDANQAYSLFSERGKKGTTQADIEALLQGNNYVLFEGYESTHITSINVSVRVNSNPDAPQGTVAEVSGTISYAGGIKGDFDAVLEKHGGKWQLDSINITVPPDKVSSQGGV